MGKEILKTLALKLQWAKLQTLTWIYRKNNRQIVYVMGTPLHSNIGDLAIAYAEVQLIRQIDTNVRTITVSLPLVQERHKDLIRLVRNSDIIAGIGGGNMGDTYPREERVREFFVSNFPDNRIVIFPQTIFYSQSSEGAQAAERSASLYADHKDLTLITREEVSHSIAKDLFPLNTVLLTPDIVLSLDLKLDMNTERRGLLLCLRDDEERTLSDNDHAAVLSFARNINKTVRTTDTISTARFFALRSQTGIVKRKLLEFRESEIVITDRLHGMVFAAITGTPCIVFSNFNHKVRGTHQWIKGLEYIRYCESMDDLHTIDTTRLISSAREYSPHQFDKYWDQIKTAILR